MYHFFVEPACVQAEKIMITGADVNHIRNVLRMKPGEEVTINDGQGGCYRCVIDTLETEMVTANICEKMESSAELPVSITLFQGLPKGDKMELIIQKCVELGVTEIVPVETRRSIVKLDAKKAEAKVRRWNGIAEGAAKQSGRGLIPEVTAVLSYKEALERAKAMDVVLVPYELAKDMATTRKVLQDIRPGQSIGIFIGPEGGFEETEIEKAMALGAVPITLGRRILRTETAGMAVLAMLVLLLEE